MLSRYEFLTYVNGMLVNSQRAAELYSSNETIPVRQDPARY